MLSVTTDYTSLFGGEAATSGSDALIAQWQGLLPGFDATQHLITNIIVEGAGNDAVARSHVRAAHWIGARFWTVGGSISTGWCGRRKAGASRQSPSAACTKRGIAPFWPLRPTG
ncbi:MULTISPECIES: nuclear transport factor 2 family protein [unclassified Mesorhizobium]|uniref:nuclear transport factor 2 family protein n=1 Tax=unclassified Mesorhizobium TaxID=325217 RepID=UPI00333A3348